MRLLLAGPKICAPWTEGRKKFVRDLIYSFGSVADVYAVTTRDHCVESVIECDAIINECSGAWQHMWGFHRGLQQALMRWRPHAVCHFPIGSFHGAYGIANVASMAGVYGQSVSVGAQCLNIAYSVSGARVSVLERLVPNFMVNQFVRGRRQIPFGTTFFGDDFLRNRMPGKTLLFMAGMSEETDERLDHVLQLRGLITLLEAGPHLSPAGFDLIVAVPLLKNPLLRDRLMKVASQYWPRSRIEVRNEIRVPEIYRDVDYFVFPYAQEEEQFIPTSVIEAMYFGVPVIVPELKFLRPLAGNGDTATTYRPGYAFSLADSIFRLEQSISKRCSIIDKASRLVRTEFSIDRTRDAILGYLGDMNATMSSTP